MDATGVPAAWDAAKNVLCVRLDTIGDVLMTTPAIRALRAGSPGRRITLLTSPEGAAVARLVPEIDDVIEYAAPWVKGSPPAPDQRGERRVIETLRGARFDAAAIFTVYTQSALPAAMLCRLAGIPRSLAHCREQAYRLLTHRVPEDEPEHGVRHETQRQLDLVASIGCAATDDRLSLAVPDAARSRIAALLAGAGSGARPWAVVHPGATAASRRYPPESFAAAADALVREHGWRIVLAGGRGDAAAVAGVRRAMRARALDLSGRLTLAELAALIEAAPVLIANNSAPVHVAAAVGTPVVDLYALTNPQHTPWRVPARVLYHDVPCRWCYRSVCPAGHHACLREVSPADVVRATLELYAETQGLRDAHRRADPDVPASGRAGGHTDVALRARAG